MQGIIIGIGDYAVTNASRDSIKTFGLGSCVAVVIMDRISRTVGMAHIALPDSRVKPDLVNKRPAYFADTGIAILLSEMTGRGIVLNAKGIIVKLAGGANVIEGSNCFEIGKRNVLTIKKELWKHRLGALAEDTGKNFCRTVCVDVDSGSVRISSPAIGEWTI